MASQPLLVLRILKVQLIVDCLEMSTVPVELTSDAQCVLRLALVAASVRLPEFYSQ